MPVRTSHSKPRPEVPKLDELPAGVPAPARPAPTRDRAGKFKKGPGTSALARKGGKAKQESLQLARLLGLWTPPATHAYAPYARLAREWRDQHMAVLAENIGGGEVSAGPASIISTAAIQLAASRYLADQGARKGDVGMLLASSKMGDASRANLLAGHELVAREARARADRPGQVPEWRRKIDEIVERNAAKAALEP